ncbi:hypothetical protein [Wolbachia pipientis]|nr:hypothetical protein [Wolbachia pipientis]
MKLLRKDPSVTLLGWTPSFFLDPSSQGTGMTKTVQSPVARDAGI